MTKQHCNTSTEIRLANNYLGLLLTLLDCIASLLHALTCVMGCVSSKSESSLTGQTRHFIYRGKLARFVRIQCLLDLSCHMRLVD